MFETVAGRTSAIVPSLQRKNGGEFCRPVTAPSISSSSGTKDARALDSTSIDKEDSSSSRRRRSSRSRNDNTNNDVATATALTRSKVDKKRKRT